MAKRFTLEYKEEYDFLLLGVFCSYRDYRLCFELDKALEISLRRIDDLEMKLEKKGSSSYFPLFLYQSVDNEDFFVIANKGSNAFFIPEMKQTDYFFLVKNPSRYTQVDDLIDKMRGIQLISSVIELDPEEIKSGDNFLFIEPPRATT